MYAACLWRVATLIEYHIHSNKTPSLRSIVIKEISQGVSTCARKWQSCKRLLVTTKWMGEFSFFFVYTSQDSTQSHTARSLKLSCSCRIHKLFVLTPNHPSTLRILTENSLSWFFFQICYRIPPKKLPSPSLCMSHYSARKLAQIWHSPMLSFTFCNVSFVCLEVWETSLTCAKPLLK